MNEGQGGIAEMLMPVSDVMYKQRAGRKKLPACLRNTYN